MERKPGSGFPNREEWLLDRVWAGEANPQVVKDMVGVTEPELSTRMLGLAERRAEEQGWTVSQAPAAREVGDGPYG